MTICANPKTRRVKVPVGQNRVILVLRDYTAAEYIRFMNDRYVFKPKDLVEDHSMQSRLRFVDDLLVGLEAEDAGGNPDTVTYVHPLTGAEEALTPKIANWTRYVNPSWKIAAAMELERESVAVENSVLKN
jgi:hypothetical protein